MTMPCDSPNLLPYETALSLIQDHLPWRYAQHTSLEQSLGRTLCETVIADRDLPSFNRSTMDGYAALSSAVALSQSNTILTDIPAGGMPPPDVDLSQGVVSIATGAAVPTPYDAVIPIEQTTQQDDQVTFLNPITRYQYIHRRASDASQGDKLILPTTRLQPHHLAIASAVGHSTLKTTKPLDITIITTGNEVRPIDTPTQDLQAPEIRNSNLPMLNALVLSLQQNIVTSKHCLDDAELLQDAISEASSQADMIVTAGSISIGQHDLLADIFASLGFKPLFHGLAIQPGKPTYVAIKDHNNTPKIIIALPGNPVSVLATFHLIAWPIIRHLHHQSVKSLPWRRVWSSDEIQPNPSRELFRAARFLGDAHDQIELIPWHTSGDIVHTATATGFVRLPKRDKPIPPGSPLAFLPLIGSIY